MTAISEIIGATEAKSLYAATPGADGLGKDDFLQLLVAQLQNQDPLNPNDPADFTAGLAQFSSLEQLFNVNDNLAKMTNANSGLDQLSALSLINKSVVAAGNAFEFDGNKIDIGYQLENSASEAALSVRDRSGRVVAVLEPSELTKGKHFLAWDGTDGFGNKIPIGSYTFTVSAQLGKDTPIQISPLVKGLVLGVDMDESGHVLVTEIGNLKLQDVKSVRSINNG